MIHPDTRTDMASLQSRQQRRWDDSSASAKPWIQLELHQQGHGYDAQAHGQGEFTFGQGESACPRRRVGSSLVSDAISNHSPPIWMLQSSGLERQDATLQDDPCRESSGDDQGLSSASDGCQSGAAPRSLQSDLGDANANHGLGDVSLDHPHGQFEA